MSNSYSKPQNESKEDLFKLRAFQLEEWIIKNIKEGERGMKGRFEYENGGFVDFEYVDGDYQYLEIYHPDEEFKAVMRPKQNN